MFVCVFIDWENIEKSVKQEFGAVLNFEEFVWVIRQSAAANGSRLVGIHAYGDFDKGTAGLMSKLVNLGIEPEHVDRLEKNSEKDFIGLNYLRKRLIDRFPGELTQISDAMTQCIDYDMLTINKIPNPNDPKYPTRACVLNRDNKAVQYILQKV